MDPLSAIQHHQHPYRWPTCLYLQGYMINWIIVTCLDHYRWQIILQHYLKGLTHRHTHPFNSPLSGTTQVSWYHKGKTNLDFTGARDSEWQWHQLGHMQVCTSLQTDNHASTSLLTTLKGVNML